MKGLKWQRYRQYLRVQVKLLLRLKGDPRVIARGAAVGIAMNFIPTIGLGLPVVYWVAALARGHKLAAMVSTMSIKVIFPILYIINYMVGELFLHRHFVFTWDWHIALKAGFSFFLGSVINFVASYLLSYHCSLWLIRRYRAKKRAACPAP